MHHQPLRDRCNVPTPVRTDRKRANASSHAPSYVVPSLSDCCATQISDIEEVPRTPHDPHGPRQFVPYFYLFSPPLPGAPPPPGNWTHTLRLLPPSKSRPNGSTDLVSSGTGGPRGLDLYLPTAAFKKTSTHTRARLHLSTHQLLLARDFLALALPYYASAHPPDTPFYSYGGCGAGWPASSPWSANSYYTPITHAPLEGFAGIAPRVPPLSQADPVRVLVLGPPRLVLAIGLLYLAYASECSIAQVMRGVLEGDGDSEWCRLIAEDGRMGLGEEDMKVLERVAMKDM